jgi:hypothetical protein
MRAVAVLAFAALSTLPAAAGGDRERTIEMVGALSVAPQICGLAVDRTALAALGDKLLPGEPELAVAVFRVNDRIAKEHGGWSETRRRAWCDATAVLADELGVKAR